LSSDERPHWRCVRQVARLWNQTRFHLAATMGEIEMAPSGTLSRPRTSSLHLIAVLALCILRPGGTARAASPSDGTITATGPALAWTGTAIGTGSANEATCVEGVNGVNGVNVNCDTFTLTVGGAPRTTPARPSP